MLRALASLFVAPRYQQEAHALYVRLVEQSRQPIFYADYAVPDTLDGRFDMITLHVFLVAQRLKAIGSNDALEFLQVLSEVFFADMDRNLREMGVGDTGISKRVKKMSEAFYGRLTAYQDARVLEEALLRNLYRGDESKKANATAMGVWMRQKQQALAAWPLEKFMQAVLPL